MFLDRCPMVRYSALEAPLVAARGAQDGSWSQNPPVGRWFDGLCVIRPTGRLAAVRKGHSPITTFTPLDGD